jgi:hypothetical protein
MALGISYPEVNGHRTSYCSIELGIDGTRIKGVKSINYKDEVEIGELYGTSSNRIGRTRGRSKPGGDIEIYQAEWEEYLLPKLARNGAIGFAELSWTITVTYSELGLSRTVTDRLIGVRFLSADKSNSEGTDALVVKCTLDVMRVMFQQRYKALR